MQKTYEKLFLVVFVFCLYPYDFIKLVENLRTLVLDKQKKKGSLLLILYVFDYYLKEK